MSYARFGSDGSDVYVFTSSRGIECCGCILQEREWVDDPDRLVFGPDYVFDRLRDPEDEKENLAIWSKYVDPPASSRME